LRGYHQQLLPPFNACCLLRHILPSCPVLFVSQYSCNKSVHISYYKTAYLPGKHVRISSNTPLAQSLLLSFSLHRFRLRQPSHTLFDQVPFAFIARQTSLVVVILILSF
jgi:hypothetical protein